MLDLFDELKAILAALRTRRIDYAVCGGLAMAVHGLARATVDIDLLIAPESYREVKDIGQELGYTIEPLPMTFVGGFVQIRRLSKLDPDAGDLLMMDLLLVTPYIEAVWQSRTEIGWESGTVSVVSREGLIALKSLRSSDQDLIDIARLREVEDES
jgi:hypothetical protein